MDKFIWDIKYLFYKSLSIIIFFCFIGNDFANSKIWNINIEGYLSGFKVGESKVLFEISNQKYNLKVESTTSGITKIFYPWKQNILVIGNINKFKILPSIYKIQDLRENKKTGYININFQNNYPIIINAHPNPDMDTRRKKVSRDLLKDTLDPVNAILDLGFRSAKDNNCNQIINVFDGRRRFNLKFTQIEKNLNELKCKLNIIRIAGYSEKELKKHPREGNIILKKLSNYNLYLPTEVKIPLTIGSFYVKLSENLLLE